MSNPHTTRPKSILAWATPASLALLYFVGVVAAEESSAPAGPQIDQLIRLLDSDQWAARESATRQLTEIGTAAVPALQAALDSAGAEVRWRALEILKVIRYLPSPELRRRLGSEISLLLERFGTLTESERLSVLRKAHSRVGTMIVPVLTAALESDASESVRTAAISLLGRCEAPEPLLKILLRPDESLRERVWQALAAIGTPRSLAPIRSAADGADPQQRHTALDLLASLGHASDVPRFVKILRAPNDGTDTRFLFLALKALRRSFATGYKQEIRSLLESGDWAVRRDAALSLGTLRDFAAAPKLAELLDDDAWAVRRAAVEALGKLRAKEFADAVTARLEDEQRDVRRAAVHALAELRLPASRDALLKSLARDGDTALDALLWIADDKVIKTVRTLAETGATKLENPKSKRPIEFQFRGLGRTNQDSSRVSAAAALMNMGEGAAGAAALLKIASSSSSVRGDTFGLTSWIASTLAEHQRKRELLGLRHVVLSPAKDKGNKQADRFHPELDLPLFDLGERQLFPAAVRHYLDSATGYGPGLQLVGLLRRVGLKETALDLLISLEKDRGRQMSNKSLRSLLESDVGRYADALKSYQQMLHQADLSTRALVHNNVAWMYVIATDPAFVKPAEAIRRARLALAIEPFNGYYLDTLGWALHRAGRHQEAIGLLRKSLDEYMPGEGGNRAGERARIARVLHALGRDDEARKQLAHGEREGRDSGVGRFEIGVAWVEMGALEKGLSHLVSAYDLGARELHLMETDPALNPVRTHAVFRTLLARAHNEQAKLRTHFQRQWKDHLAESEKSTE